MEEHVVKVLQVEQLTHDVKRFRFEKPAGYTFIPGQATEAAIEDPRWREEKRPFTFTSLNEWPDLEFTIKIYPDHGGMTNQLDKVAEGDQLVIHDVWGAIEYKGPGTFLAGGAGITPFIAIFRDLEKKGQLAGNRLIFSNRTDEDIILRDELARYFGSDVHHVITQQDDTRYERGFINEEYIRNRIQDFDQYFYVCGPEAFVRDISKILETCGARPEAVVFEK